MENIFPKILTKEKFSEGDIDVRNALFDLDKETINAENFSYLTRIYTSTKALDIRNKILKLLYDFAFPELRAFFTAAYKKERYLDMKIYALRGLSYFISENDTIKLLAKFNQTLARRQEKRHRITTRNMNY